MFIWLVSWFFLLLLLTWLCVPSSHVCRGIDVITNHLIIVCLLSKDTINICAKFSKNSCWYSHSILLASHYCLARHYSRNEYWVLNSIFQNENTAPVYATLRGVSRFSHLRFFVVSLVFLSSIILLNSIWAVTISFLSSWKRMLLLASCVACCTDCLLCCLASYWYETCLFSGCISDQRNPV